MTEVTAYITGLDGMQRKLMQVLHDLILSQFDFQTKIRYRVPFFYNKSWICYMNPIKNEGVELCFLRGNELANADGILDFKDRKQVGGISYYTLADIDTHSPIQILHEALILDQTVKYASKRKK